MSSFFKNILPALFIIFICCTGKKTDKTLKEHTYSRSADSLRAFINLNIYHPVNVLWKITTAGAANTERLTVPGPTDYKLEAFIQFDRETADKLKENSKSGTFYNSKLSVNDYWFKWLPKDLKLKEKADSSVLYEAKAFAKTPYLKGNYLFITPNTILISFYTQ